MVEAIYNELFLPILTVPKFDSVQRHNFWKNIEPNVKTIQTGPLILSWLKYLQQTSFLENKCL